MTATQEVPLPEMPAVPQLWAVHVHGPDDIIAEPSQDTAETNAKQLNDWYEARTKEADFDPKTFPRLHAEVIEWPFARETHAEALIRNAEENV